MSGSGRFVNLNSLQESANSGPPEASTKRIFLAQHIPALDGIRGFAILLVLLVHFGGSAVDKSLAYGSILERAYTRVIDTSGAGVDLFFVLSGFLITRILLQSRGASHALRNFYARRVLRIFPLYYLALFVVLIVMAPVLAQPPAVQNILHRQGWLWIYCGNVGSGLLGISWNEAWMRLDHFWSLAVEEHFYFVWPALVLFVAPKKLARFCWFFIGVAVATRLGFLRAGMVDASYQLTICRLDALSLGALIAIRSFQEQSVASLVRPARFAIVFGALGVMGLAFSSHDNPWLWWTTGMVHTVFAVFFAGLLILTLASPRGGTLARLFENLGLRWLGKYSYGLYVWHEILRPWLARALPIRIVEATVHSRLLGVWTYTLLCMLASLAVAFVSWHVFEKNFLKLKRFVPYDEVVKSADTSPRPIS